MTFKQVRRIACRVFLALVLLIVVVFALFLLWPAPGGREKLSCASDPRPTCRVISGRVVYALQKDRSDSTRALHLVLISRNSLSGPGLSIIKIPPSLRPQHVPGIGAWVSVLGVPHKGSNGERDMTADRIAEKRGNG